MISKIFHRSLAAGALSLFALPLAATTLEITISNASPTDGLYLTPLATFLHDGTFDTFDAGTAASGSLEALAEEGDAAGVLSDAAGAGATAGVITSPGGFPGAPVIDPGETASIRLSLDTSGDIFLSFLSMVIPSNDAFIGNDDATAFQVFDDGVFLNPADILITGGLIWDAGTEVNNGNGAAFAPPTLLPAEDENGLVALLPSVDFLIGAPSAVAPVGSVPGSGDVFAQISIAAVPLPAGLPLLLMGLGSFAMLRRRK
ncbi:MAG: spondin domain-containing protein [Pseudomonadota bacterium]